jgi:hypothetical protein
MLRAMRFVEVTLEAPAALVPELERFYDGITGETTLQWRAAEGDPFYHFALLLPGDRFEAAHAWADERFDLVGDVFRFENWDARAVYFHDPAGNIVELIAHRGLEENGREGAFASAEIVGFSELGVVGNREENLRISRLPLWSGTIDDPASLGFAGEKGRTLILAEEGRGWLPTGRPAEAHPVEFELLR